MIETWTCHICGDERPDVRISVYSFPIDGLPNATRNVRYCNDRPECFRGARHFPDRPAPVRVAYPKQSKDGRTIYEIAQEGGMLLGPGK